MVKRLVMFFLCISISAFIFAGDAAAFVDEGFSSDGKTYVFGQYGSTDKNWQGYAEIYTVDIDDNDYVDGGVFITRASSATSGKNGKTLYDALSEKHSSYLNRFSLQTVGINNVLYLKSASKDPLEKIVIQDFEVDTKDSSPTYHITLTPWFSGKNASSQSSFFITVEKYSDKNVLLGKQVIGNPEIKRKGVIGYQIEKIIRSPDGQSFIFVVEKTVADQNGNSIRYMVETLVDADFND